MKKFFLLLTLTLFLINGANAIGSENCDQLATVFTDGKGNNSTKKLGGNYAAISMEKLDESKIIKINTVYGTFKYVTLHARYNGGYWKTIYKGPIKTFPVSKYISSFKKDKNCTHVIISVNGAHEKYDPAACTADIVICDTNSDKKSSGCSKISAVYTNGKGDNRTKKLGGTYTAISLDELGDNQIIKVNPVSGKYNYVTLHARYKGGYWKTIYKGPIKEFPVSQYLRAYKKDKNCTHLNISVNGAHEKYEPVPCTADILVCGVPGVSDGGDCTKLASIFTDGKGNNRTKKLGGNYTGVNTDKLGENQILKVKPVSGTFKYVTLHARFKGGSWRTIYKGPIKEFPVSKYFTSYLKDRNCTTIVVSVNGAHEKYEPVACEADIYLCRK